MLSAKQEKFCIEYAKSGNARQSYIKAGYKARDDVADSSASRLLKNDKVQLRLKELTDKIADSNVASIQEMQEVLTKIIRQQIEEETVVVTGTGKYSEAKKVKKQVATKDMVNAINTLGKMTGAFVEKIDINGAIPVVIKGEDELDE